MTETFRFQDIPVESDFVQDIRTLNALNQDQLSQIAGLILSFLSSADSAILIDDAEGTQKFIEDHGVNPSALKATLRAFLLFFKGCARKQLSLSAVKDDLLQFGLSEDKADSVAQLWRSHFVALSRNMIDNSLRMNKVVDMDWRFGVTASSSELAQAGTTFLQLKLVMDRGAGRTEASVMELSLPQFYQLLQQMELAKAAMDFLAA